MEPLAYLRRHFEHRRRLGEHRARLYRTAYAWTHDPELADDLVQETLARALRRAVQLRDPSALPAWLFGILTNCWRDHLRRVRPQTEVDEDLADARPTPDQAYEQAQRVHEVRHAVGRLPQGQRQVLTLVDLEGFSYAEVAQILSIPMGTVMSRLCRARRALAALLEPPASAHRATPALRRVK